MKLPSGVKLSGTVDQLLDARRMKGGHAAERQLHDRLEMVEVRRQELEFEIARQAVDRPGNRVGLVAAHHQAADLLLVIGQAVGIAQRRQAGRHAGDRLGDDVLMLHRNERHVDAGEPADLARPLPGAVDDDFAGDAAAAGLHRRDSAAHDLDGDDLDASRRSSRRSFARPWRAIGRCRKDWPGRRSAGRPRRSHRRRPSAATDRAPPSASADAFRGRTSARSSPGASPPSSDLDCRRAAGRRSSSSRWRGRSPPPSVR